MASFSIDGVVQAEYVCNALGQQVIRRLTQTRQTIHNIFDLDGNRIAEYEYDAGTGTSTLIREDFWMNGAPVGWSEGGQVFFVRTDHIHCPAGDFALQNLPRQGRPVFATNDLGAKVWEEARPEGASGGRPSAPNELPFGGVHTSTGGIGLRFP